MKLRFTCSYYRSPDSELEGVRVSFIDLYNDTFIQSLIDKDKMNDYELIEKVIGDMLVKIQDHIEDKT